MIRPKTSSLPIRLRTAAVAAVLLAFPTPGFGQNAPSLYERLGGFDFIAHFVDVAFPRVATHPELTHLFGGHSMDSQLRQRQLVVELLCYRTGGPCVYIGRTLEVAHEGLGITAENWESFMAIIRATTEELGVPDDVRGDWVDLWEGFRGSTVLE